MSEDVLSVARQDAVLTLTLSRPHARNALDRALLSALAEQLRDATSDEAVRAIVVTGSGGSFCAGADLRAAMSEGIAADMGERIAEFHAVIRAIVTCPKPVIAAVDGAAVGFGADLALACDLRVLSTRAYLQASFVKIALMPDGGGTFWWPRLVGIGRALEILMLGDRIDAEVAHELGLANRVVEPDALAPTAGELATRLAAGPPLALAKIKHAVRESWSGGIEDALAREKAGQVELLRTQDLMIGVTAWMQRTPPRFTGR